ncbi:MAG: PKD domain-containing protein, partial [Deltaproteobacteria bacterium]|nr:PKD domain-containing protein [Deltaproteobacteria bacterium]
EPPVSQSILFIPPSVGCNCSEGWDDQVEVGDLVTLDAKWEDPGMLDTWSVSVDWGDGTSTGLLPYTGSPTNLALTATASMSAGGVGTSGAANMNDGQDETAETAFAWVTAGDTPGSAFFQYDWTSPVTISWFNIDTNFVLSGGGRTLAGGTIQYKDAIGNWVTHTGGTLNFNGEIYGKQNDWTYFFGSGAITTDGLRIMGAHASEYGLQASNPMVYEWEVFAPYEMNFNHTYTVAGSYDVTVFVTDDDNANFTCVKHIEVLNSTTTRSLSPRSSDAQPPETVTTQTEVQEDVQQEPSVAVTNERVTEPTTVRLMVSSTSSDRIFTRRQLSL